MLYTVQWLTTWLITFDVRAVAMEADRANG